MNVSKADKKFRKYEKNMGQISHYTPSKKAIQEDKNYNRYKWNQVTLNLLQNNLTGIKLSQMEPLEVFDGINFPDY